MGTKIRLNETTFACYSKVCAPPPAGSGGSSPKGKYLLTAKDFRDGERSVEGWRARMAKEQRQREEMKIAHARKQRRKVRSERWSIAEAKAIVDYMVARRGK